MDVRRPQTGTSGIAGGLMLAVTALFTVLGVDMARDALDPSRIDRETILNAIGLGLNREETQNLKGMVAVVLLALCTVAAVLGIGVLRRREGVRHAAIGTFFVFAAITIPLAVTGIASEDPPPGVVIGLAIGVIDAVIVYLLARPQTMAEFERAEAQRDRVRAERRAARRSAGSSGVS